MTWFKKSLFLAIIVDYTVTQNDINSGRSIRMNESGEDISEKN